MASSLLVRAINDQLRGWQQSPSRKSRISQNALQSTLDSLGISIIHVPRDIVGTISSQSADLAGSLVDYKLLNDPLMGDRPWHKNYRRSLLKAADPERITTLMLKIAETLKQQLRLANIKLSYVDIWQDGLNPVLHTRATETRLFHRDGKLNPVDGSTPLKLLKVFILLHDTYPFNGPFQYVTGSNLLAARQNERLLDLKQRISGRFAEDYVLLQYGVKSLFTFTGELGSAVVCNTVDGLHRGLLQTKGCLRTMLAAYFESE